VVGAPGIVSLLPFTVGGITNVSTVGTPTPTLALQITVGGFVNVPGFGVVGVTLFISVTVIGIVSTAAVGSISTTVEQIVTVGGIPSTEVVGAPFQQFLYTIGGIGSTVVVGLLIGVGGGRVTVSRIPKPRGRSGGPDFVKGATDTAPQIQSYIDDATGAGPNLNGATVQFTMRRVGSLSPAAQGAATLVSVEDRIVGFDWTTLSQQPDPGYYLANWVATLADGSVETFPNDAPIAVLLTGPQVNASLPPAPTRSALRHRRAALARLGSDLRAARAHAGRQHRAGRRRRDRP
jgi:hypothetical protein